MLALGTGLCGQAQTEKSVEFRSPFDFPLLLSANFGELRPNHFHNDSGSDWETDPQCGRRVCVTDHGAARGIRAGYFRYPS